MVSELLYFLERSGLIHIVGKIKGYLKYFLNLIQILSKLLENVFIKIKQRSLGVFWPKREFTFKNTLSCIYFGPVDMFVAILVEIDREDLPPKLHTDRHIVKYTFLNSGDPKMDIYTKIPTYNHYTFSTLYSIIM